MARIFIKLDTNPRELHLLIQSPLFRLACIVIDLVIQRGPVSLTKKLAFRRDFVAETFALLSWPNCDSELFGLHTVRDQHTFGLLEVLHDVLIDLKLTDHVGRKFVVTEEGQSLRARTDELFYNLLSHFLFRINHTYYRGLEDGPDRDWPKILKIIHQSQDDISFQDLCLAIRDHKVRLDGGKDLVRDDIDIGIIRPLCWSGLLEQSFVMQNSGNEYRYKKTPLWYRVFDLSWLEERSNQLV